MHLCHVLAADGFDDVAFVIRGVEAGAAPSLGVSVQRSASSQRILQTEDEHITFISSSDPQNHILVPHRRLSSKET